MMDTMLHVIMQKCFRSSLSFFFILVMISMQIALYRINVFKEMGSCKCIGKTPELNGTAKEIQDHFQKDKKNEDSKSFKEGYIDGVNLYFKVVEMSN